ncbi:hypothetical protein BMR02_05515 [Methylococcaceae bacterium HT1]|nr:hypothetical protein BMR02_05515 [Methylococcaceae bacterium HT1]TXL15319.1 hypothetical protein BMR05_04010 [Methylococcaceae bacterium HT4]TXL20672.1 hypothetical protein BMR06_04100 [Methylococcaceae bacterium HT5]TXL22879.1 hypothetical protein BMR03_05590 [Methylococcaceae bacterium HT2]
MKVTFLKIAEAELDDAFEYYESVQNGLGFRFLTEVELSKARIQHFPFSYGEIGKYSRPLSAPDGMIVSRRRREICQSEVRDSARGRLKFYPE